MARMSRYMLTRIFQEASKTIPCPKCNGKKYQKGPCRRCGGRGFIPAPFRAHK